MYNPYQQPHQGSNQQNLYQQQTGFVNQGQQTNRIPTAAGFGNYQQYVQPLPPQQQQQQQQSQHQQQQQQQYQQQQYQQQQFQQQQRSYGDMNIYQQQQPQQTGYYMQGQFQAQNQLQTQLQPQKTSQMYGNSPVTGITSAPTGFDQALKPQQTGYYAQQQWPNEPLKPNATGFVNSFASNGINKELHIPLIRLSFITPADQAKFENLFRHFVQKGSNTISGSDCRTVLLRSGLNPSQLARIWTLCDTNKAGELLFPEFALAMSLVNTVLKGDSIPHELPPKIKNEVNGFVDAINFSCADQASEASTPFDEFTIGIGTLHPQATGFMPPTSFGVPMLSQMTGGTGTGTNFPMNTTFNQVMPLQSQHTGGLPNQGMMQPQITGGAQPSMSGNMTGVISSQGMIQPQLTGGTPSTVPMQRQITGGMQYQAPIQSQYTGGMPSQGTGGAQKPLNTGSMPQISFGQPLQSQNTGSAVQQPMNSGYTPAVQSQPTGFLPPASFAPTAPLVAQKTGFGNNEIYNNTNFISKFLVEEDRLTPEEKSLFYKIFDTYDSEKTGLLHFKVAAEVFRKSGLNRSDLEHIWNLCDTNGSGQLNKQEFALGMHLIYRKLNGYAMPNVLPPSLVPSSTRILNNVKKQLKGSTSDKNKKEPTRIDGLAFKHNDDDVLPSFRNRRKSTVEQQHADENKETIKNLRNAIDEKTHQLNSEKSLLQQLLQSQQAEDEEAKKQIERLKEQILSLPIGDAIPPHVPPELRSRFESLANKIPILFNDITRIDEEITSAKIQLYSAKNPSAIVGSGPNGEITEYDQRKAKQKALLASRMAALTGTTIDAPGAEDIEIEEKKFSEQVAKIRDEHKRNRDIINDIKSSITEISTPVSTLIYGSSDGSKADPSQQKWELGIDLEPEVFEFVKQLRNKAEQERQKRESEERSYSFNRSQQTRNTENAMRSSTTRSPSRSPIQPQVHNHLPPRSPQKGYSIAAEDRNIQTASYKPSGSYYSDYNDANGRAEYVKQQANNTGAQGSESGSYNRNPSNKTSVYDTTASVDEEEDEEERILREKLEALKLRKRAERQAAMTSSIPNSESPSNAKMDSDGNSSWDDEPNVPSQPTISTRLQKVTSMQTGSDDTLTTPAYISANNTGTSEASKRSFFKQPDASSSTFDLKAAEQQRRLQRGLDDSDGWSDDEADKEENGNQTNGDMGQDGNSAQSYRPYTQVTAPSPVPIAPPLPQLIKSTNIASEAEPKNEGMLQHPPPAKEQQPGAVSSTSPAVPVAPPLPPIKLSSGQAAEHNSPDANSAVNNGNNSDVLSLPESVDSEDEYRTPNIPFIPPPPPLP
ncbi:HDR016Cp [Eremothecium sinecaudum]|uniref:Actin cytoskeleton-regulatory complex protein PAN1 n=1 Tax=Eremothecium sinecaudum TaxID=45286 RepID=A0A0X8HSN9_9SACH|nr:HDR016Cp [Eremothecium sinecaudum]AMD20759.1 HDR016Cp [Eremothecium sinecaudum]